MHKLKISKTLTCAALTLILTLCVVLFFKDTINYQSIQFDDIAFADAFYIHYNSAGIIKKIFASSVYIGVTSSYYRPLLTLSFYFDSLISRGLKNFQVNHTSNILLHLFCVLLLFYFLKTFCFDAFPSFLASLLFALNIFSVNTTAWISGRNDSLLFIFIFLSFIFFIKANESGKRKYIFLILHCVFLFAGLLTKETACLIPVLCVGYSMMQKRENKFLNPVYFIWIIPLAAYFILRMNFSGGISLNLLLNPSNIKNNIYMVADYLSVAFMLSKDEVYPEIKILTFLKGFAILTVFFVSALLSKHKRQSLFFLSFSIIFLMPNFLIDRALFQGNRMYLPAAFLITSAFYIAMPLYKKYKSAVTAAALLFIFTTAVTANNRMPIFENSETFFAASDNFSKMKPYLLLGYKILSYLKFYNQADETVQLLKKKDMLDEETVHNLIFINMQLVNYEEIIKLALNYGQYLSKDKDYYDMLIFCYTKTGNPQEAERMRNFSEKTP